MGRWMPIYSSTPINCAGCGRQMWEGTGEHIGDDKELCSCCDSKAKKESEMGCVNTIDHERFPKQGDFWWKRVLVCFNYDVSQSRLGTVVRCDAEEPGKMIIKLDDGRHLLSTECQYKIID